MSLLMRQLYLQGPPQAHCNHAVLRCAQCKFLHCLWRACVAECPTACVPLRACCCDRARAWCVCVCVACNVVLCTMCALVLCCAACVCACVCCVRHCRLHVCVRGRCVCARSYVCMYACTYVCLYAALVMSLFDPIIPIVNPAPAPVNANACNTCGRPLQASARFCTGCGSKR